MDPRPDLRIPPLGADGVYSVPNVLQKPDQAPGGEPEVYGLDLEGPEQRRRGQGRRADKEHKYFTCKCGAICRVPVGKGKIVITCPKCGAKIEAKS